MPIQKVYLCDCLDCTSEPTENPSGYALVQIGVSRLNEKGQPGQPKAPCAPILLCEACMIALTILPPPQGEPKPDRPLSLDEIIKKMIRKELSTSGD